MRLSSQLAEQEIVLGRPCVSIAQEEFLHGQQSALFTRISNCLSQPIASATVSVCLLKLETDVSSLEPSIPAFLVSQPAPAVLPGADSAPFSFFAGLNDTPTRKIFERYFIETLQHFHARISDSETRCGFTRYGHQRPSALGDFRRSHSIPRSLGLIHDQYSIYIDNIAEFLGSINSLTATRYRRRFARTSKVSSSLACT